MTANVTSISVYFFIADNPFLTPYPAAPPTAPKAAAFPAAIRAGIRNGNIPPFCPFLVFLRLGVVRTKVTSSLISCSSPPCRNSHDVFSSVHYGTSPIFIGFGKT